MWILIDDIRSPEGFDVIVRNPSIARELLQGLLTSTIDGISFDHDLGEGVETGYQLLCWAIEKNLLPNNVELITSNPVGLSNMRAALLSAGYIEINPRSFKRKS